MLRIFRNWPNATTATICAATLVIVFLLSIATAPADHQIASAGKALPSTEHETDSVSGSGRNWFVDHSVDLPLNLP